MKLLVTGGAGFIGSHLVSALLQQGHTVWTLDDLSAGRRELPPGWEHNKNHIFIKGSILDRDVLKLCIDQVDAVFHLAAILGVKNTVESPKKVIEGNLDGTRNVLELAYERGSRSSSPRLLKSMAKIRSCHSRKLRIAYTARLRYIAGVMPRPNPSTNIFASPMRRRGCRLPSFVISMPTVPARRIRVTAWSFPGLFKRRWRAKNSRYMATARNPAALLILTT